MKLLFIARVNDSGESDQLMREKQDSADLARSNEKRLQTLQDTLDETDAKVEAIKASIDNADDDQH